ncbi:protein DBF4 homolog B, partial [Moschus berezovskii]|uniref:protein DBF4 homolog B n=1 Tax=Moschus berezovskii TaxID=68408 RepID=UPI002443F8D8
PAAEGAWRVCCICGEALGAPELERAHGVRYWGTAALKEHGDREREENWRRDPGKGNDRLQPESSMDESRLRAPDPGAQLGVSSCLGKCQKSSPDARRQPFSGKSFYLDLPAGKNLQFLTGAIQQLGGVIEGFLSKEVSYIVSSRREAKAESSRTSHRGCPSPSEVTVDTPPMANPKGSRARPAQKAMDPVPLSRGKELLQKAIRNQGSSSGGGSGHSSSLLSNARSWGVQILHVDEMLIRVQQLSLDAPHVKKQGLKKSEGTCPAESRTRKVARLKAPFLKVEDDSRKFRPFHLQFKSFPEISFLGPKAASPFEAPMTRSSSHHTREARDQEPSRRSAACTVPRRRKGYCECCQEAFEELHRHLQSPQHQGFGLKAHLYAEVDRIIAQLSHSFADLPFQASLPGQPGSLASDCDPLCPEPPPLHWPSPLRAASPWRRKGDHQQAPGATEHGGSMGGMKAAAEPVEAGEIPGPTASCRELKGSADSFVDPPETPGSGSPAYQGLLTSSGLAELSSGPDLPHFGHKRKVQFPSGSAEKRPGASWPQASLFLPRAPSPCGTPSSCGIRTASSKHLPLPGHEPRSLASLQAVRHPQGETCLSPPGSPPIGWQSAGPHRSPGLGEEGPQDLSVLRVLPLAQSPSRLSSSGPAASPPALSCRHGAPRRTCREPGCLSPPPSASQRGDQLLPMVLDLPVSSRPLTPNPSPPPTENYFCESLPSPGHAALGPDSSQLEGKLYVS